MKPNKLGVLLVNRFARLLYYLETSVYKDVFERLDSLYELHKFEEAEQLIDNLPQNPVTTKLKIDLRMKKYLSKL